MIRTIETQGNFCEDCRHNRKQGDRWHVACEILEAGECGIIKCEDYKILCKRKETAGGNI